MSAIHQVMETQSQASGLMIEGGQRQLELAKHLLKIWSNLQTCFNKQKHLGGVVTRVRMLRTIHPVGQGGFASEYFTDAKSTFVYDCGSLSPLGSQIEKEKFVDASLMGGDVDCLFISHFDEDHVSLIPALKARRKIKRVVIPLVDKVSKNLVKTLFDSSELAEFLLNPEEAFGEDVSVYRVEPFSQDGVDMMEPLAFESEVGGRVQSGQTWRVQGEDWEYAFFNVRSEKRIREFNEMCSKLSMPIDTTKLDDIGYVLDHKKELKQIYKRMEGGINQNSLLVYSGPSQRNGLADQAPSLIDCYWPFHRASGCFYTGDYDCTDLPLVIRSLGMRKDLIGTIQIPHHGSKKSWDDGLVLNSGRRYFIQCGSKNIYGHPAMSVIQSVYEKDPCACVSVVQEFASKAIVQRIV